MKEQPMTATINTTHEASKFTGVQSIVIKAADGKTLYIHAPGYEGREGFTVRTMPGTTTIKPHVGNVIEIDVEGSH